MNLQQRELVKLAAASIIVNHMIRQAPQAAPITKTGSKAGVLALLSLLGVGGLGVAAAGASQFPVARGYRDSNGEFHATEPARPLWQYVRDYNQEPAERAIARRQQAVENAQNRALNILGL